MKIAEVSKEYGLSADTLRYYERIGLLPNVTRTASGIRDYSEQDCARVQFAKCMRAASVSIVAWLLPLEPDAITNSTLAFSSRLL